MLRTLFITSFQLYFVAASLAGHTLSLRRSSFPSYSATLTSTSYGQIFDTDITVGNQTFTVLVDTGSSDLWVLGQDYICLDDTSNATLPRETCNFGTKTYTPSSSFHQVPDMFFGEQLGGGRVSGVLGTEVVTLGDLTVKEQHFGLVNKTSNTGDGINVGILGLGYPSMTSGHNGSIVGFDNTTFDFNRTTYNPVFNSMIAQGLVDPFFSIALERTPLNASTGPGGYLTLGGLPPVPHSTNFSSAPVEIAPLPINYTGNKAQRSFWYITVDGVAYGSSSNDSSSSTITTNTTSFGAVVDTGNFYTFLDDSLASQINALFDPPAQLIPGSAPGTWSVACNATAPSFGVTIGGQTFFHDGRDLILNATSTLHTQSCVSSIVSDADVSYGNAGTSAILGDPFFKNVVSVFDFGRNEMRFAARTES